MIRFIDLGDQIGIPERKHFAWYDTVTDTFEEFNGNQRWEAWEEFESDFYDDDDNRKAIIAFKYTKPLIRYKGLFPKSWP